MNGYELVAAIEQAKQVGEREQFLSAVELNATRMMTRKQSNDFVAIVRDAAVYCKSRGCTQAETEAIVSRLITNL